MAVTAAAAIMLFVSNSPEFDSDGFFSIDNMFNGSDDDGDDDDEKIEAKIKLKLVSCACVCSSWNLANNVWG